MTITNRGSAKSLPATHDGGPASRQGLRTRWRCNVDGSDSAVGSEVLTAAVQSACFAMALTARLDEEDLVADRLCVATTAILTVIGGVSTVAATRLVVRGEVCGLAPAELRALVEDVAVHCRRTGPFTGIRVTVTVASDTERG